MGDLYLSGTKLLKSKMLQGGHKLTNDLLRKSLIKKLFNFEIDEKTVPHID